MKEMITRQFEGKQMTIILDDKENPWFVAKEVMEILGIKNQAHSLRKLDLEDKGEVELHGESGLLRKHTSVSEAGFYELVMQSNRPNARACQKWVTKDVLPSIRKTGSYSVSTVPIMTPAEQLLAYAQRIVDNERAVKDVLTRVQHNESNDSLTHDQATQLDAEMNKKYREIGIKNFKILGHIKKQVKAHFFDNPSGFNFKEIPRSGFETALDIVRNFKPPARLMIEDVSINN